MLKRIWWLIFSIIFLLGFFQLVSAQEQKNDEAVIENIGANAQIDWTNGFLKVVGNGVPPENIVDPAQRKLMAKRAAQADAYRNLAEAVNGIRVTSTTYVKNFIVANDEIRTKVEVFIKGAQVTKVEYKVDEIAEVTIQVLLNGDGSLSGLLMPNFEAEVVEAPQKVTKPRTPAPQVSKEEVPVPVPLIKTTPITSGTKQEKPPKLNPPTTVIEVPLEYTGIVIIAKGLGIQPSLAPKIYDENGNEIYSVAKTSLEARTKKGYVIYYKDEKKVDLLPRVSDKPFKAKAVKSQGTTDLVIKNTDAEFIIINPTCGKALKDCKVIILI